MLGLLVAASAMVPFYVPSVNPLISNSTFFVDHTFPFDSSFPANLSFFCHLHSSLPRSSLIPYSVLIPQLLVQHLDYFLIVHFLVNLVALQQCYSALSATNCVDDCDPIRRFISENDTTVSVEQLALEFYASDGGGGWKGVHCEGGVWTTLFVLLLWDIIFAPLPDVFRTPLQNAPLDLDTDAFGPSR